MKNFVINIQKSLNFLVQNCICTWTKDKMMDSIGLHFVDC